MVAGILFQLASTCIFVTLFEIVLLRSVNTIRGNRHLLTLSLGTMLTITCMVIRGVYRSMELLQGWRGYLITNERFAIALEGSLMSVALLNLNINHPSRLLAKAKTTLQARESQPVALRDADNGGKGRGAERP